MIVRGWKQGRRQNETKQKSLQRQFQTRARVVSPGKPKAWTLERIRADIQSGWKPKMRRTEPMVHETHQIETQVTGTESRLPFLFFGRLGRTQLISFHASPLQFSTNWCVIYMMHSRILAVGLVWLADGRVVVVRVLTAANTHESHVYCCSVCTFPRAYYVHVRNYQLLLCLLRRIDGSILQYYCSYTLQHQWW